MAKSNTEAAPRRSTRTRRQIQSIYDGAANENGALTVPLAANNKKKRIKRISPLTLPIYSLPDSVLRHITGFVEEPSRVFLAVALTASSSRWKESNFDAPLCSAGRAILSQPIKHFGEQIDFIDTDKKLAAHLTDEDVGGVLACVGAVHKIKTVKLTHCVDISGYGLRPLRGSKTLQQLDLDLIDKKNSFIMDSSSKLSESDVIPILDSIVDADGSMIKHIQFPKKWREERSQLLSMFLGKYNCTMNKRSIQCITERVKKVEEEYRYEKCGNKCCGIAKRPWISKSIDTFGTYNFTCYSCTTSYCGECANERMPDELCEQCERRYCAYCYDTLTCDLCEKTTCHDCTWIDQCQGCEKTTCNACCPVFDCDCCYETRCVKCVPYNFCDVSNCYACNCDECSDEDNDYVKYCPNCSTKFCGEHMLKSHAEFGRAYHCSDCNSRAAMKLSENNKSFGEWVQKLEEKYGIKGRDCLNSTEDFDEAMEARKEWIRRCLDVGKNLLPKQKQFEKFDTLFASHKSDLEC